MKKLLAILFFQLAIFCFDCIAGETTKKDSTAKKDSSTYIVNEYFPLFDPSPLTGSCTTGTRLSRNAIRSGWNSTYVPQSAMNCNTWYSFWNYIDDGVPATFTGATLTTSVTPTDTVLFKRGTTTYKSTYNNFHNVVGDISPNVSGTMSVSVGGNTTLNIGSGQFVETVEASTGNWTLSGAGINQISSSGVTGISAGTTMGLTSVGKMTATTPTFVVTGIAGIGTVSPLAPLHVEGTQSVSAVYPEVFVKNVGGKFVSLLAGTTGNALLSDATGFLDFGTITGANAAGYATQMRLQTNGNLSIGLQTDIDRLYVQTTVNSIGGIQTANTSTGANAFTTAYFGNNTVSPTGGVVIGITGGNNTTFGSGSDGFVYNNANGNLLLGSNSLERMRINNSGEVGIGVTASAGTKLQLKGAGSTTATLTFNSTNSSNTPLLVYNDGGQLSFNGSIGSNGFDITSLDGGTVTYKSFNINTSLGNNMFYVRADGRTVLADRLTVNGFDGTALSGAKFGVKTATNHNFQIINVTDGCAIEVINDAGNADNALVIYPSETRIQGKVTINSSTVSPTSGLQVIGIPAYTTNANALAGGLTAGAFYYTDTAGEYILKIVH